MAMVKVWNDNKYAHEEDFKGKKIRIEPGKFIVMDFFEAHQFAAQFSPISRNADGVPIPQTYKMIRVAEDSSTETIAQPKENLKCNACSYVAASAKDLEEHSKTHADIVLHDEEAEQEMKKKRAK